MNSNDERARYRINWVAEQTGLPETTLRAWERRYKVPEPARTPSGYRLYSDSDVEKVRRMQALCATGMAPSDAARALEEEAEPRAPVQVEQLSVSARIERVEGEHVLVEVRLEACLPGSEPRLLSTRQVLLPRDDER